MKFLKDEKFFKSICLFVTAFTMISILIGTKIMKIMLIIVFILFIVYVIINVFISVKERKK